MVGKILVSTRNSFTVRQVLSLKIHTVSRQGEIRFRFCRRGALPQRRQRLRDPDADAAEADEYGERCVLDFSLRHEGREARVRSTWIIRKGANSPRLTNCYVL
jgi:hypothetical protein